MNYDYGFDLPDVRHTFFTEDGGKVKVSIVRHWYRTEDDETNFKVSFNIQYSNDTKRTSTELPMGTREEQAIEIAHTLYPGEDKEATDGWNKCEAISAAERRMGA